MDSLPASRWAASWRSSYVARAPPSRPACAKPADTLHAIAPPHVCQSVFALVGTPNLKTFAVTYSIGNLAMLFSTFFLIGPLRQLKLMTSKNRLLASIVYVVMLILTLVLAMTVRGAAVVACGDRAAHPRCARAGQVLRPGLGHLPAHHYPDRRDVLVRASRRLPARTADHARSAGTASRTFPLARACSSECAALGLAREGRTDCVHVR